MVVTNAEVREEVTARGRGGLLAVIIGAGVGGLLPTLSRLAPTYVEVPDAPLPGVGLYVGLAVYFVLGAVVAVMYRETDFRKAIVLGIAAPGIVTSLVAGQGEASSRTSDGLVPEIANGHTQGRRNEHLLGILGIGVAYADPAAGIRIAQAGTAHLTVIADVRGMDGNYSIPPVRLRFLARDGRVLASSTVDPRNRSRVAMPAGATSIRAESGGRTHESRLPRPPFSAAELHLRVEVAGGNDFLWALGGRRTAKVSSIEISVEKVRRAGAVPARLSG